MSFELYIAGKLIGSVYRGAGNVMAWLPDGRPLGQFANLDVAAAALAARAA